MAFIESHHAARRQWPAESRKFLPNSNFDGFNYIAWLLRSFKVRMYHSHWVFHFYWIQSPVYTLPVGFRNDIGLRPTVFSISTGLISKIPPKMNRGREGSSGWVPSVGIPFFSLDALLNVCTEVLSLLLNFFLVSQIDFLWDSLASFPWTISQNAIILVPERDPPFTFPLFECYSIPWLGFILLRCKIRVYILS